MASPYPSKKKHRSGFLIGILIGIIMALVVAFIAYAWLVNTPDKAPSESPVPETVTPSPIPTPTEVRPGQKFLDILNGNEHHLKIQGTEQVEGNVRNFTTDQYIAGNMFAISRNDDDFSIHRIIRDGTAYEIDHEQQIIQIMDSQAATVWAFQPGRIRYVGSGQADIFGRTLDYEDYSNNEGISYRFFIEGGQVVAFQTEQEVQKPHYMVIVTAEILQFESTVPDKAVFDLPDYPVEQ